MGKDAKRCCLIVDCSQDGEGAAGTAAVIGPAIKRLSISLAARAAIIGRLEAAGAAQSLARLVPLLACAGEDSDMIEAVMGLYFGSTLLSLVRGTTYIYTVGQTGLQTFSELCMVSTRNVYFAYSCCIPIPGQLAL